MDANKVASILIWPSPSNMFEVRSFHGLASFYRKFIGNSSLYFVPILGTIKGGQKYNFVWTKEDKEAFQILKKKVEEKLVLIVPNFQKVFTLKCDASDVAVGEILS